MFSRYFFLSTIKNKNLFEVSMILVKNKKKVQKDSFKFSIYLGFVFPVKIICSFLKLFIKPLCRQLFACAPYN